LFPGAPSEWVHLGDLLRLAGHGVLLWTMASWLVRHWQAAAVSSALEERQEVARRLHDGIAQDLALLSAQSEWLSKRVDDSEDLAFVALVAQHALAESRRTIASLRGLDGGHTIVPVQHTAVDVLVDTAKPASRTLLPEQYETGR
jgi:signal transduction histidine kinase